MKGDRILNVYSFIVFHVLVNMNKENTKLICSMIYKNSSSD